MSNMVDGSDDDNDHIDDDEDEEAEDVEWCVVNYWWAVKPPGNWPMLHFSFSIAFPKYFLFLLLFLNIFLFSIAFSIQSGRSSPARHGDAYFLDIYGFMEDPIAATGPYENQECMRTNERTWWF